MKVIRMAVFNDRKVPMTLRIQGLEIDKVKVIEPGQMEIVENEIGNNSVSFFKIWENNQALLSSMEER